jgi:capsular polysaccharide biosynthesis protein
VGWGSYWRILRRRWWIVALILVLDVFASGYLYRKASHSAGYQSCMTLYVADLSAPSLIAAPSDTLDTAGQALAGETAANFFADDILDVSQSSSVAAYVSRRVASSEGAHRSFLGSVSGSRKDRTVNLCISDPAASVAGAAGSALAHAMTADRKLFVGPMAKRIYTRVISSPTTSAVPATHSLLSLAARLLLGLIVALGVALLWDALDPGTRDADDVERALRVPVVRGRD